MKITRPTGDLELWGACGGYAGLALDGTTPRTGFIRIVVDLTPTQCLLVAEELIRIAAIAVPASTTSDLPPLWVTPPVPGDVLVRIVVPRGQDLNSHAPAESIAATRDRGDRVLEVRQAIYCGGDHCSRLWNLRCDSPLHQRHPSAASTPEGK